MPTKARVSSSGQKWDRRPKIFSGGQIPYKVGGEYKSAGEFGKERLYDLDRQDRQDALDSQSFETEAEPETPWPVSMGLNSIMNIIKALEFYVFMLQLQAYCG